MKTYSAASTDLWDTIQRMRDQFHPDLKGVTVGALLVFDDENGDQILKLHGYYCAAVVSITPLKQRALNVADAIIVVDRSCWLTYSAARRDALIDHELQHLVQVVKEATETDSGGPVYDALGRPKLTMRKHDHELGWFDEVARRHGDDSMEVKQARELLATTQQLYFDFADKKKPASPRKRGTAGSPDGELGTEEDALYPEAVRLVLAHKVATTVFLEMQLHIGYNRAAKLLETMEARSIVGPLTAAGSREILEGKQNGDTSWPRWSEDNGRYENKDGTVYDGPLGHDAQTPMH